MEKYKVKAGDTLAKIAKKYGITEESIIRENKLKSRQLHVGQELIIPAHIKTFVLKKIETKKPIDNLRVAKKVQDATLKVIKRDTCGCTYPKENFPYTENTFNKIKEIAPLIKQYAIKYSVPPIAVAGSIADEYNIINESKFRQMIDSFQDNYLIKYMSNDQIEFDTYFNFESKFLNATKHDLGIGNIKLETAKKIYHDNINTFKSKKWDYTDIVRYIETNEGTVHLASLVIKKAQEKLNSYISDYCDCKKEAVLVTYYKQGDSYVEKFLKKKKTKPKHEILPGEGCRVSKQRDKLLKALQ